MLSIDSQEILIRKKVVKTEMGKVSTKTLDVLDLQGEAEYHLFFPHINNQNSKFILVTIMRD